MDSNNFYYRSSPWNDTSNKFVGRPATDTGSVNTLNLLYPTTIINLGMKDYFYSEITFDPSTKGYILPNIDPTSYGDTSDLINLFVENECYSQDIIDKKMIHKIISYFNKTINNEYYLITANELENLLSKDMYNYYFPLSTENQSASLLDKNNEIFANIYNKLKLNTIQKHVYNDGIMSIMDCYCKNMMFDFLSENLNMKYDLKNLYNNLITTYYRPIIKYFTNGVTNKILWNLGAVLSPVGFHHTRFRGFDGQQEPTFLPEFFNTRPHNIWRFFAHQPALTACTFNANSSQRI